MTTAILCTLDTTSHRPAERRCPHTRSGTTVGHILVRHTQSSVRPRCTCRKCKSLFLAQARTRCRRIWKADHLRQSAIRGISAQRNASVSNSTYCTSNFPCRAASIGAALGSCSCYRASCNVHMCTRWLWGRRCQQSSSRSFSAKVGRKYLKLLHDVASKTLTNPSNLTMGRTMVSRVH